MKFFRKPVVAVIIALVVVWASTLLSFQIRFGDKCQEITDGFIDGVYYNGELQPSLASRLTSIIDSVKEIKEIAELSEIDTDDLDEQAEYLENALRYSANDADYVYYCYEDLTAELKNVKKDLSSAELAPELKAKLSSLYSAIQSEEDAFDTSGYNESVREFLREYNKFPANELYWHTNVMMPSYFS